MLGRITEVQISAGTEQFLSFVRALKLTSAPVLVLMDDGKLADSQVLYSWEDIVVVCTLDDKLARCPVLCLPDDIVVVPLWASE